MNSLKILPVVLLLSILFLQFTSEEPGGVYEGEYNGIHLYVENGALHSFDSTGAVVWCMAPNVSVAIDAANLATNSELKVTLDNVNIAHSVIICENAQVETSGNEAVVTLTVTPGETKEIKLEPVVETPGTFQFVFLGDNRDGAVIFNKILNEIQQLDAVFAFDNGDIVSGGREYEYVEFHDWIKDLSYPMYPVIGNHELAHGGIVYFEQYYGRRYYSFVYDNSYFIILDDSDDKDPKIYGEQKEYLISELGKAQAYDNIFVIMHVPPFWLDLGAQYKISETNSVDEEFTDLMQQYNVDIVMLSHIHGYGEVEYKGVKYVVSGGAGAPIDGTEIEGGFYHYILVSVNGNNVSYEVVKVIHPENEPALVYDKLQQAIQAVASTKTTMGELVDAIQSAKDRGATVTAIENEYNRLSSNFNKCDAYIQTAQEKYDAGYYREANEVASSTLSVATITQTSLKPLIEQANAAEGKEGGNTLLYVGIAVVAVIVIAGIVLSKKK
ncbi:MAG: metallophosphoesterase family protein [Candidatus Methanofastidiosia archaeon]